jgi:hypothetical protein
MRPNVRTVFGMFARVISGDSRSAPMPVAAGL